jgi:hypothetical protein
VSPVKYELGFYIPEDTILHSHRRENLKSYARGLDHREDLRHGKKYNIKIDLRLSTAMKRIQVRM